MLKLIGISRMSGNSVVIRFAVRDDVDRLMESIKNHWDSSHILAHNKEYFLYLYGRDETHINMVIGENHDTKEIMGFLGFIRSSSHAFCDVSLALWKTINRSCSGIGLLNFLIKEAKPNVLFCVGINPTTALPIYKALKYHTGKFDHYYRIIDRDEYKIATIVNKYILPIIDSGWDLMSITDFDVFREKIDMSINKSIYPHKDIEYLHHRYFAHPVYQYVVYAITKSDILTIPAFLVCREVKKNGRRILRIIDYLGDESFFAQIAFPLQKLIDTKNYEYIDCYCFGMSETTMNNAGLIRRTSTDLNIIPNYFEPFLSENIDIYYFTSKSENFRAFKGDGDQDQPRVSDRSLLGL